MQTKHFLVLILLFCIVFFGGSTLVANDKFVSIELCYNGYVWKWSDDNQPKTTVFTNQIKAEKHGRFGTNKERCALVEKISRMGFSLEDAFNYTFYGFNDVVKDMCSKIDKQVVDASMQFNQNVSPYFFFSEEQTGFLVEKDKLYTQILDALNKKSRIRIDVKPKVIKPKVTVTQLKDGTVRKSRFETSYASSSPNRKNNIELAAQNFNGLVVLPNQEVSFNKITGRRTQEKGYKEANIIVNNEYTQSLGGGVCQVSTTLYNALVLAEMEIKEVHPHSLASGYVLGGFDAMVNFGSSDLRWKNSSGSPIYIRTYANGQILGVEIYGIKNNFQIKRFSQEVKTISPPEERVEQDANLFVGEWHYKSYPKNGSVVKSYLEYYKDGVLCNTKQIRTSTYKPMQGVKVVGTKQKPVEEMVPQCENFDEIVYFSPQF